ncbi:hypothetical protein EO087_11630 [Dyella sp. M7H15-1]|uniref:RHS repeat domain-containing protein n=1 Tax=Dyella sp. M7H15-1 TaxID=2501295 RepID=UPI001005126B|nr:RHS repeat-associated core domain-containing protein [Dyella sp. M7H15-1]QAU24556.1 hypothetical protein EO087_11630 [Dyella sp. M7H15-1]
MADFVGIRTRDSNGRIQAITAMPPHGTASTVVSNVSYQPFGPVSGYTLGNGQQVTRAYDANYRLTDLTSPAFTLHVARDAMGNITAIGNAPGATPATETYTYDPLYRLTQITEADGSTLESVTYNQTGDRLSKTGSGLATGNYGYNPNTHQLIATGNAARSVDANGNTTAVRQAGSVYGFGYNDRNRMAVAQLAGNTVGSYTYNALNQRVQKVANGVSQRFSYNEASQMLAEYGATNRDYIWMDGIPVANVDVANGSASISYVTADQLGTPRAIADSAGSTLWQFAYHGNPWGEMQPTSNGYVYNLHFPGQYLDTETGLNYNVNRDFDSGTGRYLQSDLIGLKGGLSTFSYVGANPLADIDPLGLSKADWKNRPMDPNGEGCINLAKRIQNLKAEIQRQIENLANNPGNLAYYAPGFSGPGGALKDSVWGHEQLLFKYQNDLANAIKQYNDRCGGRPPDCPTSNPNQSPDAFPLPPTAPAAEGSGEAVEEGVELLNTLLAE